MRKMGVRGEREGSCWVGYAVGSMQVRTGIPERACVLLSVLQEVQLPGSPRPLCISQFSCGRKHAWVQGLQCSCLPGRFLQHSDQQERPHVNSVVSFCSSEPNFQDLTQCSSSMKPSQRLQPQRLLLANSGWISAVSKTSGWLLAGTGRWDEHSISERSLGPKWLQHEVDSDLGHQRERAWAGEAHFKLGEGSRKPSWRNWSYNDEHN